jgi:hypothetical protein
MLDFVQNNNPVSVYRALARLQEDGVFPSFLENYQFPDKEGLCKYSSTGFASPDTRSFPIMNPASTLLSAICFYGDGGTDQEIEQELVKAAAAQGISEWLEKAKEISTPMEKQASSVDSDYALVLDYGAYKEAYLPIRDEQSLQESARGLADAIHSRSLPLVKAAEVARTIVKRAAVLDIPEATLPGLVLRFAEDRLPDPSDTGIQLSLRKRLVGEEAGEIYEHIFKQAAAGDDLDVVTELLEDMDRLNLDIDAYRYTGLEDAWTSLHSGLSVEDFEKIASEYLIINVDGQSCDVPVQAIRDIPEAMIKAAFLNTESAHILSLRDSKTGYELGAELDALRTDIKQELLSLAATYGKE